MTPEEFQAHVCGELTDLKKIIGALQSGQTAQNLSLQALQIGQGGAVEHLGRINGSVRELYKRTDAAKEDMLRHIADCSLKKDLIDAKQELMNHVATCPLKEKVEEITADLSSGEFSMAKETKKELETLKTTLDEHLTEKKTSEKWWHVLQPVIWIVASTIITAIITLILSHANLFQKP